MRRLHLFEWEDQPWLPAVFRDFITDHLRYTLNEPMRKPVNRAIAVRLKAVVQAARTDNVVDLCAGAGGPLIEVSRVMAADLDCPVHILLTDLFPNTQAFERIELESLGRIATRLEPTSALDVPQQLSGVRTLFTSFHHFRPEQARGVLADAAAKRAAIAIFEPLERTVRMVVLLGLMSFVRGFTHTPFVGRLTVLRALFTYVVPLAPAVFAWDGMVSVLRSYSPEELAALAEGVGGANYTWEAGRFDVPGPYGPMPTVYLVGLPT